MSHYEERQDSGGGKWEIETGKWTLAVDPASFDFPFSNFQLPLP
jgi:hypothetical protein